MIITKQYLATHSTKNKGWTEAQLKALGIKWPPVRGWQKRIIGRTITDEQCKKFENGAGRVKKKQPAKRVNSKLR